MSFDVILMCIYLNEIYLDEIICTQMGSVLTLKDCLTIAVSVARLRFYEQLTLLLVLGTQSKFEVNPSRNKKVIER